MVEPLNWLKQINNFMNRSFSKIRHIQESNQKLEQRILNEQMVGGQSSPSTISKDYLFLVSAGGMHKVFPVFIKKGEKISKMGSEVKVVANEGPLSSSPDVGGNIPSASTFKPLAEVYLNCMDGGLYVRGVKSSSMIEKDGMPIEKDGNYKNLKNELQGFCSKS